NGDYILFYGQGASIWTYNESQRQFFWQQNQYDVANYYFIKVGGSNGQRIAEKTSVSSTSYTTNTYSDYSRFEPEEINILHEWSKTQGAGKQWFGDHFKVAREYTYPDLFKFDNLDQSAPVFVEARLALRSKISSSYTLQIAGQNLESNNASGIPQINTSSDNTSPYARIARVSDSIFINTNESDVTLRYPYPQGSGDDSEGWVDWVQFNVRSNLVFNSGNTQTPFRDIKSLDYPNTTFELQNANEGLQVWDVTAPLQPRAQQYSISGGTLRFGTESSALREFIAFDPGSTLLTPAAIGQVPNQNVHGITDADMVIIYHPDFEAGALRLAEHRADFNNITIELVTPEQIFNEFGGGRAEPTAIRDFCRMLYDRSGKYKHLLLIGDASFDNRDIYGLGGNYLPSYQDDSLNPVFAYPTDDLYGVLYGTNSNEPLQGDLNIAVGRLPVKTNEELERVIDKIINYDEHANTLGDWRNQLVFVADDGDDNTHQRDADGIAEDIQEQVPFMNLEKIYLDAFPEESTPGGERYPLATEQLNRSVIKGAFSVTYLGHGGPKGWAQERVLNISDILSWDNKDNMPIFITATCTFTGFDDPTFVSAGEEVMLNPNGGALALMTTVRPVYTGGNKRLTANAMEYILSKDELGRPREIGEAYRLGKNATSDLRNTRKFALIGDPAMPLALPQFNVATTAIN
ncbi:MAG: type IX secretion system sortase PorU, partial [Mameliella sp.]|nr:type IX secretion system sortase PorU [Phaeodactylibacter sp.]